MVAGGVFLRLKPNRVDQFTELIEQDALPSEDRKASSTQLHSWLPTEPGPLPLVRGIRGKTRRLIGAMPIRDYSSTTGIPNSLNDSQEITQATAELVGLHCEVLARVFALQTLLQDLDLLSPQQVQQRTEDFRKKSPQLGKLCCCPMEEDPCSNRFDGGERFSTELTRPLLSTDRYDRGGIF
jgi:hypothetical protein